MINPALFCGFHFTCVIWYLSSCSQPNTSPPLFSAINHVFPSESLIRESFNDWTGGFIAGEEQWALAHSFLGSCTIGDKLRDYNFILCTFFRQIAPTHKTYRSYCNYTILLISANPPPLLAAIWRVNSAQYTASFVHCSPDDKIKEAIFIALMVGIIMVKWDQDSYIPS